MIDIGSAGRTMLESSHSGKFTFFALYGGKLTEDNLIVDPGSATLNFDATAQVQATGSLTVISEGRSLRPRHPTDPLAPFGQMIGITYTVGDVNISLGYYDITDVPSATETARRNPFLVTGSLVQLSISDRLSVFQDDTQISATTPRSSSAWAEIQRMSPIPVVRSLPDAVIPSGMTYSKKYDAIVSLMALMGAEPAVTREGALTARISSPWLTGAPPVATISAVISRDDGFTNNLYNAVAVTNASDSSILGYAEITNPTDPLSVTRWGRRRVKTIENPLATTQAAANASAQTYLARYSTINTQTVTVECPPRWDLELGDMVLVIDPITCENLVGAITGIQGKLDPTATMKLTITESV